MENNNPSIKPVYILIVTTIALIIITLIARPFTGNDNQIPQGPESPLETSEMVDLTPTPSTVSSETGELKKFTITGGDFTFSPNMMKVTQGDTVQITFANSEGTHDLVVEGYNVRTKIIPAGKQEMITFTADKKGEFVFFCSVSSHRQMGMTGTLIVE